MALDYASGIYNDFFIYFFLRFFPTKQIALFNTYICRCGKQGISLLNKICLIKVKTVTSLTCYLFNFLKIELHVNAISRSEFSVFTFLLSLFRLLAFYHSFFFNFYIKGFPFFFFFCKNLD